MNMRSSLRPEDSKSKEEKGGTLDQNIKQTSNFKKQAEQWNMPTLLQTNAQSLVNKVTDIEQHMTGNYVDICCITESWCSDSVPDNTVFIPNCNISGKNRSGRGIMV